MTSSFNADTQALQQIRKLTEVTRAITYAASLDEVLQLTVDRAAELLAANKCALMVAGDDGLLTIRSSHGIAVALVHGFREPSNETLVPRLADLLDEQPHGILAVPLVVGGAVKGILTVARPAPSSSADQEEWLLSALADQAAVALEKTRLDEVGEFREQLIGIIGHDLRNPLNTVLMAAQLLLRHEGLGATETELVRKITNSATLATRLIHQLLDLTRSRLGGGIPIDPSRFDMHEVCQQIVDENELTHLDRPLQVEIRGDVIGVWDRDRMYQLVANLVGNAIQHGEPRSTIELRIDGGETDVVIEVFNRGEPISEAALPFVFHAYRQGRRVARHKERGRGLGLGLFIARGIARSHGGSIGVTSSLTDGTTFRVRVPRDATDSAR